MKEPRWVLAGWLAGRQAGRQGEPTPVMKRCEPLPSYAKLCWCFLPADAFLCTHTAPPFALPVCCYHPHPQVLFRVALALLKLHEPLLLAQDNPGELLQATRRAAAEAFDRDALMKVGADDWGAGCGCWWAAACGWRQPALLDDVSSLPSLPGGQ